MNDDTPNGKAQPETDLDTTPTQDVDEMASGWQMPKPVFQKTSGYLPQGFEKQFGAPQEENPDAAQSDPVASETPELEPEAIDRNTPEPPPIEIEAQPDVIEDLGLDDSFAEPIPDKPAKSGGFGRIVLFLFALIAVTMLVIIFGFIVWYLLTPTPEATIF